MPCRSASRDSSLAAHPRASALLRLCETLSRLLLPPCKVDGRDCGSKGRDRPSTLSLPHARARFASAGRASKQVIGRKRRVRKRLGPTSVDDALVVLGVGLCGVLGLAEVDGRGSLELAAGVVREDARPERTDSRLEELLLFACEGGERCAGEAYSFSLEGR